MSDVVIVAIVAAIPGVVSSILTFIGNRRVNSVKNSIDGLLDEKTIADKEIGKKQGVQQEKAAQKDRDDMK